MGNDNSKQGFLHALDDSSRNTSSSRSRRAAARQQQQQNNNSNNTNGMITALEPIDRRAYFRNQDKRFGKLAREERLRYVSPLLTFSGGSTNSNNNKLGPLPPLERPEGLAGQPRNHLWPEAWAALLVRCSAIAPFSTGQENDSLSTSDFVSFMLQVITSSSSSSSVSGSNNNNNNNNDGSLLHQSTSATPQDLLTAPPARAESNGPLHEDEASSITNQSEWLVIDTAESRIPFVGANKPWPLEECCICLNLFDRGLNRCGRCHQGVCSDCLLFIVKPVKIDLSNDARIKAAISKKKRVVDCVTQLIKQEENKLKEQRHKEESARKYLERQERRQQREHNNNTNNSEHLKNDSFCGNGYDHPAASVSFPNLAKMAASKMSDVIDDVRDAVAISFSSPKTLSQQEQLEDEELTQAKRILELLNRQEVTGLFIRPRNKKAPRRNSHLANNNNIDDETTEDEFDDADFGISSSSSSTTTTNNNTDNDDNNNDDDHHRSNQDPNLKRDNLLCGSHHWPTPVSMEFDDCSDRPQSILEKVRLAVQKALRVESRGQCPLCMAQPAVWYYSGRKLRTRMLYELMQQNGAAFPKIIEVFAEVSEEEEKEKKKLLLAHQHRQQQQNLNNSSSSNSTSPNNVINNNSFNSNIVADTVWVQPTQSEALEYETCIALALSSVVSAVAESNLAVAAASNSSAATASSSSSSSPKNDNTVSTNSSNPTSSSSLLRLAAKSPFKNVSSSSDVSVVGQGSSNPNINKNSGVNDDDDDEQQINNGGGNNKNNESSSTAVVAAEILAMEKSIQSVEWASLCKNCGSANWKEYRCRVCRATRMN